jgi:hypothetical protein
MFLCLCLCLGVRVLCVNHRSFKPSPFCSVMSGYERSSLQESLQELGELVKTDTTALANDVSNIDCIHGIGYDRPPPLEALERNGSDGHQDSGYQGDGYQDSGYQGDGYQRADYQGDGYQGDGYQGDGYQRDGYQGDGYQRADCQGYDNQRADYQGYDNQGNGNGYYQYNGDYYQRGMGHQDQHHYQDQHQDQDQDQYQYQHQNHDQLQNQNQYQDQHREHAMHKMFLCHIPSELDSEGLKQVIGDEISGMGSNITVLSIVDCKVIWDRETHNSRGYGFITFGGSVRDVETLAALLQRKKIMGKRIAMRFNDSSKDSLGKDNSRNNHSNKRQCVRHDSSVYDNGDGYTHTPNNSPAEFGSTQFLDV